MMTLLSIFHTYYVLYIYTAFRAVHITFNKLYIIISVHYNTAIPSLYQPQTPRIGILLVDTTLANYKVCDVGSTIHIFICIYHIHIL